MDEECLEQVQEESLARDMLDRAYHHRYYKSESRDGLAGSMSGKMNSNDVSYPIRSHRDKSIYVKKEHNYVKNHSISADKN